MKKIYILDQDYIGKDKKFKKDGFVIRIFKNRSDLVRSVVKKVPDLVLFDLYSKRSDNTNISGPSSDSQAHSEDGIEQVLTSTNILGAFNDSQAHSEDDIEQALIDMQGCRDKAREEINKEYFSSGIRDIKYFLSSQEISISFPVAMFTRYGRQLLNTEDIMMLQKEGVYFVWKNKLKPKSGENRYDDGFNERERESIEDVMQSYSASVTRISPQLERFRTDINKNHNKYQLAKSVIGYAEYLFLFVVIISCLANLRSFLDQSHSQLVDYMYGLFSVPWVSIGMLFIALSYSVLRFAYRYSNIKLDESYEQANTLLRDLIKSRGRS